MREAGSFNPPLVSSVVGPLMKNHVKNKNPFIPAAFVASFIFALICYLCIAKYINETRSFDAPPEMINLVRIVVYLFAIFSFIGSFLFERHIRTKSADKYIKQGKDPDLVILIGGLGLIVSPAFLMFLMLLLGGSINDVYICSILSFVGIIYWTWYQRDVFRLKEYAKGQFISNRKLQSPEAYENKTKAVFFRSYSIILIFLSFISIGLFTLKLVLVFNPPNYYAKQFTSIDMITIPLYFFITICCSVTAILRYRRSPYALYATETISFLLFFFIPIGTMSSMYWLFCVRKKERPNKTLHPTRGG